MENELETFKREHDKAAQCFEKAISFSNLSSYRVSAIHDYFLGFSEIVGSLNKNLGDSKRPLIPDGDIVVAPGIPGSDKVLYESLVESIDGLKSLFLYIHELITTSILGNLINIIRCQKEFIGILKSEVLVIVKERQDSIQKFVSSYTSLVSLRDKIEKLHKKDPINSNDMTLHLEQFRKASLAKKSLWSIARSKHIEYLNYVQSSVLKIKIHEISQESQLKNILFAFIPIIQESNDKIEQSLKKMGGEKPEYSKLFSDFVEKSGIIRTTFFPTEFSPFQFDFADPLLDSSYTQTIRSPSEVPLFFATIIHSFQSGSKEELTVEVGERFYVYENPINKWIYVENNTRRGFVPSLVLQIEEGSYAFAFEPYVAINEGEMSCSAGQLLLISPEAPNEYITLHGEKGVIPPHCIVREP